VRVAERAKNKEEQMFDVACSSSLDFFVCHICSIRIKMGENWRVYNGRGAGPEKKN
jgi:hypothetical protein